MIDTVENRFLVRREVGDEGYRELRFGCEMEVRIARGGGEAGIESRLSLGRAEGIIHVCRAFDVRSLDIDVGDDNEPGCSVIPRMGRVSPPPPLAALRTSPFPKTEVSEMGLAGT